MVVVRLAASQKPITRVDTIKMNLMMTSDRARSSIIEGTSTLEVACHVELALIVEESLTVYLRILVRCPDAGWSGPGRFEGLHRASPTILLPVGSSFSGPQLHGRRRTLRWTVAQEVHVFCTTLCLPLKCPSTLLVTGVEDAARTRFAAKPMDSHWRRI